jgi:hypothetical protein
MQWRVEVINIQVIEKLGCNVFLRSRINRANKVTKGRASDQYHLNPCFLPSMPQKDDLPHVVIRLPFKRPENFEEPPSVCLIP